MHIYKPKIVPEFYISDDGLGPRVLYVVKFVSGELCNVDDAGEAVKMLDEQCREYVELMARFSVSVR